jgi:hypothetical protein
MALFGHGAMSDMSPLSAPKRTSAGRSKFMGSRPKGWSTWACEGRVLGGVAGEVVWTMLILTAIAAIGACIAAYPIVVTWLA